MNRAGVIRVPNGSTNEPEVVKALEVLAAYAVKRRSRCMQGWAVLTEPEGVTQTTVVMKIVIERTISELTPEHGGQ